MCVLRRSYENERNENLKTNLYMKKHEYQRRVSFEPKTSQVLSGRAFTLPSPGGDRGKVREK